MSGFFAREPLTIGGVLDQTFRLAVACFVPLLPFTLLQSLCQIVVQGLQFARNLGPQSGIDLVAHPSAGTIALGVVLGIAAYVGVLVCSAGATYRTYEMGAATEPPPTAWSRGVRRTPAMIGMGLALVLTMALPIGAGIVITTALWAVSPPAGFVAGVAVVGVFLYLVSRFLLAGPEVVVSGLGPIKALVSSWKLTRGHVTRLSVVLLIGGIIGLVVYFVLGLSAGLIAGLVMRLTGMPGPALAALMVLVLVPLIAVFAGPFASALILSLWHDLKLRTQGPDLAARIDALDIAG